MMNPAEGPRRARGGDGASLTDRPTTKYVGLRSEGGTVVAREDDRGRVLPLYIRHDLRAHSEGFEWDYAGSGPAQLALAILADCVGVEQALLYYQRFKREVVASLEGNSWELSREEVLGWHRAASRGGEGA